MLSERNMPLGDGKKITRATSHTPSSLASDKKTSGKHPTHPTPVLKECVSDSCQKKKAT